MSPYLGGVITFSPKFSNTPLFRGGEFIMGGVIIRGMEFISGFVRIGFLEASRI